MEAEDDETGRKLNPTHLVIMCRGLEIWSDPVVEEYPEDVVVHCSECNCSMLTFDGVDVMGERLAEEVRSVIKRHRSVQKISFVGHSLGGLIARYAIGRLYERGTAREVSQGNEECRGDGVECPQVEQKARGNIAGLEPMNFITFATPHLGTWGHKQVPVFCGFQILEKAAARTSWSLGRTGKHLFLTDRDRGKPPLLLQMVYDTEDIKFLSALKSFRRHVAYANVHYDHLVGWSTSSIRRKKELPKFKHLSKDEKYPHIVHERIDTAGTQQDVSPEDDVNIDFEEEMIRGLTKERFDVSFRGSRQKYLAHRGAAGLRRDQLGPKLSVNGGDKGSHRRQKLRVLSGGVLTASEKHSRPTIVKVDGLETVGVLTTVTETEPQQKSLVSLAIESLKFSLRLTYIGLTFW